MDRVICTWQMRAMQANTLSSYFSPQISKEPAGAVLPSEKNEGAEPEKRVGFDLYSAPGEKVGWSSDEEGSKPKVHRAAVPRTKPASLKRSTKHPRLAIASSKTASSSILDMEDHFEEVLHYCLSEPQGQTGQKTRMVRPSDHKGVTFDLYPAWNRPRKKRRLGDDAREEKAACIEEQHSLSYNDLIGLAELAQDVAEVYKQEHRTGIVISDFYGRDFCRMVVYFAASLLKRHDADKAASIIKCTKPPTTKKYKNLLSSFRVSKARTVEMLKDALKTYYLEKGDEL